MDKEILKALEDTEFAEKILECISPEEVQGYFEEIGIDITEEDVNKILCSVYGVDEEAVFANDYDLSLVAGGSSENAENRDSNVDQDVVNALVRSAGAEKVAEKFAENKKRNNPAAFGSENKNTEKADE